MFWIVRTGRLEDGCCGTYGSSAVRVITLANWLTRPQRHETFAHELAHALDPLEAIRRPVAMAEVFATSLAPELLRWRPATVADAQPLIDEAHATRPIPTEPPEIITFGLLDLGDWAPC